jgi:uncharacterized membrane protein
MRVAHADAAAVLILVVLASGVAVHAWNVAPRHWNDPDSLFYRATVLRIEGTSKAEAFARVVNSGLARGQREYDSAKPPEKRRVMNPRWVSYSWRFYERRWVAPLIGAALDPIFGANGLIVASLIAYVLLGPFLYLLLRQRFPLEIALFSTCVVLLLHTVREWATWPMTDAWGLSLECLALAAGLIALDRGARWLAAWALAVATLSFTRDTTLVLLVGAVAAFASRRDRRSAAVLTTGVVAALPAPLIFGASVRETIAYTVNNFFPPPSSSWNFVFSHFLHPLRELIREDLVYLGEHLADGIALVGGFLALFAFGHAVRDARAFLWGAACGSLVTLLVLPNYSAFRLELVVVPFSALGLAAVASVVERLGEDHAPVLSRSTDSN